MEILSHKARVVLQSSHQQYISPDAYVSQHMLSDIIFSHYDFS